MELRARAPRHGARAPPSSPILSPHDPRVRHASNTCGMGSRGIFVLSHTRLVVAQHPGLFVLSHTLTTAVAFSCSVIHRIKSSASQYMRHASQHKLDLPLAQVLDSACKGFVNHSRQRFGLFIAKNKRRNSTTSRREPRSPASDSTVCLGRLALISTCVAGVARLHRLPGSAGPHFYMCCWRGARVHACAQFHDEPWGAS